MKPLTLCLLAGGGLLLMAIAYKVGRIFLRILVGLAVLALLGWGFWHFLLK